jgi:hypothetical protein
MNNLTLTRKHLIGSKLGFFFVKIILYINGISCIPLSELASALSV